MGLDATLSQVDRCRGANRRRDTDEAIGTDSELAFPVDRAIESSLRLDGSVGLRVLLEEEAIARERRLMLPDSRVVLADFELVSRKQFVALANAIHGEATVE